MSDRINRSPPIASASGGADERTSPMADRTHPRSCPCCDLYFVYHAEIVDHVRRDHAEHADVVATIEPREIPAAD
jgi:hypothetical protein